VVIVSEECRAAKPDAEIFLHACRSARVDPSEATYVGDQYELDVKGARGAGMRALWLRREMLPGAPREQAVLSSLADLPTRLVPARFSG
jgi:putative hydrolase of the HAD superfamily